MAEAKQEIIIEVKNGIGKESKKPWKAISLKIGDISQLIFPKTKFEMDYIENHIDEASISIFEGVGKESKKPYKAVKLDVAEWSQLIFPNSGVEMDYIAKVIDDNAQ